MAVVSKHTFHTSSNNLWLKRFVFYRSWFMCPIIHSVAHPCGSHTACRHDVSLECSPWRSPCSPKHSHRKYFRPEPMENTWLMSIAHSLRRKAFRLYALCDPQINLPCHKHSFDHKPCFETQTPRCPQDMAIVYECTSSSKNDFWHLVYFLYFCIYFFLHVLSFLCHLKRRKNASVIRL